MNKKLSTSSVGSGNMSSNASVSDYSGNSSTFRKINSVVKMKNYCRASPNTTIISIDAGILFKIIKNKPNLFKTLSLYESKQFSQIDKNLKMYSNIILNKFWNDNQPGLIF